MRAGDGVRATAIDPRPQLGPQALASYLRDLE